MKLHATVTSERTAKKHGGNQFLDIAVRDKNGKELTKIHVNGKGKEKPRIWISCNSDLLCFPPSVFDIGKAGERPSMDTTGQNCIYDHDHSANGGRECMWHN